MPAKRVREILDEIRGIHGRLADGYESMSQHTGDERLKLLLEYMTRKERDIDESLAAYEEDAAPSVLDTWFQFTNEKELEELVEKASLNDETAPAEVVFESLHIDKALTDFYRQLAEETESVDVKELFASLVALEEGHERQYAKALAEFRDE